LLIKAVSFLLSRLFENETSLSYSFLHVIRFKETRKSFENRSPCIKLVFMFYIYFHKNNIVLLALFFCA